MTTYDANREFKIFAFGISSSEDAVTWHWFHLHSLKCFQSVSLLKSDGAKGVKTGLWGPFFKTAKVGYKDEDLTL